MAQGPAPHTLKVLAPALSLLVRIPPLSQAAASSTSPRPRPQFLPFPPLVSPPPDRVTPKEAQNKRRDNTSRVLCSQAPPPSGGRSVCCTAVVRVCAVCFCRAAHICVLRGELGFQELSSNPTLSLKGPSSSQPRAALPSYGVRWPNPEIGLHWPHRSLRPTLPQMTQDEGSGERIGQTALKIFPQPDARNPELPEAWGSDQTRTMLRVALGCWGTSLFLFERFVTIKQIPGISRRPRGSNRHKVRPQVATVRKGAPSRLARSRKAWTTSGTQLSPPKLPDPNQPRK